jgi:hypothetical protein
VVSDSPFTDAGAGYRVDALPPEGARQVLADLLVLGGHQARHELDEGHLGAVGAPDVCELCAGGPGPDDYCPGGRFVGLKGLPAADHDLAVDGQRRYGARPCTGGDYDLVGRELSVRALNLDGSRVEKDSVALHDLNAVLVQQKAHPGGELFDHIPTTADRL